MSLINLYKKEKDAPQTLAITMFFASSVAAVFILISIITFSSLSIINLKYSYVVFYIIMMIIYVGGKRLSLRRLIKTFVFSNSKLTKRVSNKIRNTKLSYIEKQSHINFYRGITDNRENFVESVIIILHALHSSIILFFVLLFMWFVSTESFVITVLVMVLSIYFHTKYLQKDYEVQYNKAQMQEQEFAKVFHQLLHGFKELKLNSKMSLEHFDYLKNTLTKLQKLTFQMCKLMINNFNVFFDVLLLFYLGIITFLIPEIITIESQELSKILIVAIFMNSPVGSLFGAIPFWIKSNNAVAKLYSIEKTLDDVIGKNETFNILPDYIFDEFQKIQFKNVKYNHYDREGNICFTLGSLNLDINRGELIFIVGGNGSGKSTLMKLICGLYNTAEGEILIDGHKLSKSNLPAFYNLFSIIMSDYFLFEKLYGLQNIDNKKIDDLLKIMNLDKKTAVINNIFTTTRLSTGQRKRLAMIVSLLQDKQIYIFDEWAADQDVNFRSYFYEVILNDLKNKGKTIIAVSHDDRFYHVADRVMKLEYGNGEFIV